MINRKKLLLLALAPLLAAAPAAAGDVGININLGIPVAAPVPIIVHEPPLFLAPPTLGFSVAVGVPYDLFIVDGRYYLYNGNVWHVGSGYNGPWRVVVHDHLPPGLRKHKVKVIHEYRDREYGRYRQERDHYRGRTYRPDRYDHRRGDDDRHRDDHDRDRGDRHGNGHGHGKGKRD